MKVEDEIVVEISWDELGVSDEEEREVCEVMALVGSVDDIWSEIVLSSEENIWSKDGDAGKIWSFDEAIEELSKKIDISGWSVLVWLTVIVIKMIGKVFELKECFAWVKKQEVILWSMIIGLSKMMAIVMMTVVIQRVVCQSQVLVLAHESYFSEYVIIVFQTSIDLLYFYYLSRPMNRPR